MSRAGKTPKKTARQQRAKRQTKDSGPLVRFMARLKSISAAKPAQRLPLWVVWLAAWWLQAGIYPWPLLESWRPELLLIMLTFIALRVTPMRGALFGLAAGWSLLLSMPHHAWLVLSFWALTGYLLAWLRTQWYTEGTSLFVVVSCLLMIAWHLVGWFVKALAGGAPRAWSPAFVLAQLCATAAYAWLWARYAPRYVAMPVLVAEESGA